MPKVSLLNMKGETAGELELKSEVFEVPYNEAVLHQVMVSLMANNHRGTHSTKTRGMVSGGGKKPYRQKGTGSARRGSSRSPLMRGGAITFGPVPHKYTQIIPRKMRRLAMRCALSQRLREEQLIALDKLSMSGFSTKEFIGVLKNLKYEGGRLLVLVHDPSIQDVKSAANVPDVRMVEARNLNLLDVINYPKVVATSSALDYIQEVLG